MKDNGALLFCTSYFRNGEEWRGRYLRWFEHHRALLPLYGAMAMIDDGSPCEPEPQALTSISASDIGAKEFPRCALVRFPNRLGRLGVTIYPGWCRSFLFSLDIAECYGFSKIVHVESDAYLLSGAIVEYIDRTESGWIAFWSGRYRFPETALQIVCEDAYPALARIRDAGVNSFRGKPAELVLPFTRVEKSFSGDRFSEYQEIIPADADYAVQVQPDAPLRSLVPVAHRWRRWLHSARRPSLRPVQAPSVPDAEQLERMSDAEAGATAFKSGLVALERGYFEAAKHCLQRATRLHPQDVGARMVLGRCLMMLGDSAGALKEGLAALRIEPDDFRIERLLGEIYATMKSFEAAVEHSTKALELEPTDLDPLLNIRALEQALQKGSEAGDLAESRVRAQLKHRLERGALDEQGYRALLLTRERTPEGLSETRPVADAVAGFRTLDRDEVQALVEVYEAVGDVRRRDQFRALLKA